MAKCVDSKLFTEIQRLSWAQGLEPEMLHELLNNSVRVVYQNGEHLLATDKEVSHVYFVIRGSVNVCVSDVIGQTVFKGVATRGNVLGLYALVANERSTINATAIEETLVLCMTLETLLQLGSKHQNFQLAVLRIAGENAKRVIMSERALFKPTIVTIVHHSNESRPLTAKITSRLKSLDEELGLVGDQRTLRPEVQLPFRAIESDGKFIEPSNRIALMKEWANYQRIVIDVSAQAPREDLQNIIAFSDVVLWCIKDQDAVAAMKVLFQTMQNTPNMRDKLRVVWVLGGESSFAPYFSELNEVASRDFKVRMNEVIGGSATRLNHGLERIVHHLRGVKIGLALGGGAARGMAHLGVFKALEDNGICVDVMAGTSAGAMTGTIYAAGLEPTFATSCFKNDLLPPWIFRRLPACGYWYLLYKYRMNRFEPMLRKYLKHARMEQLYIPMATVAVDLVEGAPLFRQHGDAAVNILESINLPPLSLPRFDGDQAVVDGGLLNNVPADLLLSQGCNFVIASTVTAKIEKDFMGARSKRRSFGSRIFSTIQVIMRQNMIQSYNMNSVGIQPADLVIAPDVSMFDITAFTRADEMAVIGEKATNDMIPQLRTMLSKLDAKLFN